MRIDALPGSTSLRSRAPSPIWPKRFRVQMTLASGVIVEEWGDSAAEALALIAAESAS